MEKGFLGDLAFLLDISFILWQSVRAVKMASQEHF